MKSAEYSLQMRRSIDCYGDLTVGYVEVFDLIDNGLDSSFHQHDFGVMTMMQAIEATHAAWGG